MSNKSSGGGYSTTTTPTAAGDAPARTGVERLRARPPRQHAPQSAQARAYEADEPTAPPDAPERGKGMRLREFTENYLETYKKPFIKPSTYERYKTCLKHIPNIKFKNLTTDKLQQIVNDMAEAHQSSSSIKQVKILLSQALNFAIDEGKIVTGDIRRVKIPKISQKKVFAFTENEQKKLFLGVKNSYYEDLFLSLLFTGCRVGELIALEWSDIDLRGCYFEITKTDGRGYLTTPKTADSVRRLPINAEFREILIRKYNLGVSGRIFRNTLGRPIVYRTLLDAWHRVLDASGLPYVGLHVLRHTYATNALRAGVDVKVLSKLLGHASVAITLDLYCDVSDEDKQSASQLLTDYFVNLRGGAPRARSLF